MAVKKKKPPEGPALDQIETIARAHFEETVNLIAPSGTSWNVWGAFREHARAWWSAPPKQLSLVADPKDDDARRQSEIEHFRAVMKTWQSQGIPTPSTTIRIHFDRIESKTPASRRSGTLAPIARGATYSLTASVGRRAINFALAGAADAREKWVDEFQHPIVMRDGESVAEVVLVRPLSAMKRTLSDKEQADLAEAHRRWRETDQDVLDLLHNNVVENSPEANGQWFASYDGILDALGREKKKKGGYSAGHRAEDRYEMHQSVLRLVAMGAAVSGRSDHNGRRRMSPAILAYEYEVRTDASISGVWYTLGSWASAVVETSIVPLQIVRYGNERAYIEARLGRLLAMLLAGTSQHDLTTPVKDLLQEIRMPIDESKPGRTRERFERALKRLEKDRIIADWGYDPTEAAQPFAARGFLNDWLGRKLVVGQPAKALPA